MLPFRRALTNNTLEVFFKVLDGRFASGDLQNCLGPKSMSPSKLTTNHFNTPNQTKQHIPKANPTPSA